MGLENLAAHILNGYGGPLGKPRIIKCVDMSVEAVREVRAKVGPDTLVIWRKVEEAQPLDDPVRRAHEWMERHRADILALDDPLIVFEGYNEIVDAESVAYAEFEVTRVGLLHAINRNAAVLCSSVGTPDLHVWAVYQKVLDALRPGDVVALHEYWSDEADLENRWHVARFSLVPQLAGKAIVITECGRDFVEGKGSGWRDAGISEEQYLKELRRASAIYHQYPQCRGAVVFQIGSIDSKWRPYDVAALQPRIVAEYEAWTAATPPKEEQPMGYYQSSRNGHKISHVVMHDTEGPTAAALSWWQSPNNPGRSSAHYLITSTGQLIQCVDEAMAAHHAGYGTLVGLEGLNPNLVSIGIELEYPKAPASPPYPQAQWDAAVKLTREIVRRYGIKRENVVTHAAIDPARRSDPRNFDMRRFLDAVYQEQVGGEPMIELGALREAVWNAGGVAYNPDAALPKYAREHQLGAPLTGEVDVAGFRAQGFTLGIAYCRIGDWAHIQHIAW